MMKHIIFIMLTTVLLQSSLLSKTIDINKISKTSKKELVVYLHITGCSYCNAMSEFTFDDDAVLLYLKKNFHFIDINVSDKERVLYNAKVTSAKQFSKDIGYAFYPSVLFFNRDGSVKYAALGYKDEAEFLLILQYIHQGFYKKMQFAQYKKQVNFKKSNNEIDDSRKYAN